MEWNGMEWKNDLSQGRSPWMHDAPAVGIEQRRQPGGGYRAARGQPVAVPGQAAS